MNVQSTKEKFLSPQNRHYGSYTPENLLFNANLQEFAHKISILFVLYTGGKLSSKDAYAQIKQLWQQLTIIEYEPKR